MSEVEDVPMELSSEEFSSLVFIGQDDEYPMPEDSEDKPLKVDADELEYVVLVPTGSEYPYPQEQEESESEEETEEQASEEETSEEDTDTSEEELGESGISEEAQERIEDLESKVAEMKAEKRKEMAERIAEKRDNKGILTEDKEKVVARLSDLNQGELQKLEEDVDAITVEDKQLSAKAGTSSEDDSEDKKSKVRAQLYGDNSPLEKYKDN